MVENAELIKEYKSREAALKIERNVYLSSWMDIRNYLAPRTARFPGEKVNDPTRQDLNIINSSPRDAVRTLAAGLQAGITSPLRPWFRLALPDLDLMEEKGVKQWLYLVERRMRDIMGRSNLYDRLKSNYHILGTYGTSTLFIEEDENDVIRAYDYPLGSYSIATDYAGRVDTLYRDVNMTVIQIYTRLMKSGNADKIPQTVKDAYTKGNYYERYPLVHIVEPNKNYKMGSDLAKHKKYASILFDCSKQGQEAILDYRGYDNQPHMCPRWEVLGEDTYGTGCGEYSLGDAKQLQLIEKRKLQLIDKNTNPTMVADASMRNQRVSNLPGDTVYVNGLITGKSGYQPAYQVNPYINELREERMTIEQRIDTAFYKNLFLMISEMGDQPNITATQINMLREEKMLMLGPVLERLNTELLAPIIARVFSIMEKRGLIPEPPEEIQGMPINIEYISVLAQAQKAMGIGNIERLIGFVATQSAIWPEMRHKIDPFEIVDAYADGIATAPNLVRSNDEANKIMQGEQQNQQLAQGVGAAGALADMAQKAGGIDLSKDSPITRALDIANAPA